MKKIKQSIIIKNFVGHPMRSTGLIVLVVFLSITVFAGTLVVGSLRRGLSSLDDRLGADLMVVPYEATTKANLKGIILQGSMGYFYMNNSNLDKLSQIEGIDKMSTQLYLVSTSSGCCSVPVEIVGFDPTTDFTITPWIKKSYGNKLEDLDVVVGNDLKAFVGDTLKFYGVEVNVAAKLDKTGTGLDTAVYTNENTIKKLIQASLDKKMNTFKDIDPDKICSCVMINVADGYSPEEVMNDINLHSKKITAISTKNMISDVSNSLEGVSDIIGVLIVAIWIIALGVLTAAFTVTTGERKKELALMRAVGASKKKLSRIVMGEGMFISFIGSLIGVILGALIVIPFGGLIESSLKLPFLLPSVPQMIVTAVVALVVSAIAGSLTCLIAGYRVTRMDIGQVLRVS